MKAPKAMPKKAVKPAYKEPMKKKPNCDANKKVIDGKMKKK